MCVCVGNCDFLPTNTAVWKFISDWYDVACHARQIKLFNFEGLITFAYKMNIIRDILRLDIKI